MLAFIITTIISFIIYLFLTTGSGTEVLGLWSYAELLLGAILSLIVGFVARTLFIKDSYRMLNPIRWIIFVIYVIGPFFYGMTKANFDVAYRVITGKINPGIVKISPQLKLTTGTLTVDIDDTNNDLYIHWINVKTEAITKKPIEPNYVCGSFCKWVRRIAE